MNRWKETVIGPKASIKEALRIIENAGYQIALVLDPHHKLLGTVTDGDIRRGILKGLSLDASVDQVMSSNPTTVEAGRPRDEVLRLMQERKLRQIPLLDDKGTVVGIDTLDGFMKPKERENLVVLMAGGKGERLLPLTKDCPKPLLKLGAKPILEITIEDLVSYGFKNFCLSVNYKAEMLESHFGDGSRWNAKIEYVKEDKPLGTAGALGLLPKRPQGPVMVMNADLLTKVNYDDLLDFHSRSGAEATMCVRKFHYQVPFGKVSLDDGHIVSVEEKPTQSVLVNGGIYVLEPSVLDLIPRNEPLDMPQLFQRLIELKRKTVAFPVREYWIDIGRTDDYQRALVEAQEIVE